MLIDGGFFQKAYRRHYPGGRSHSPEETAKNMHKIALEHAHRDDGGLYRIFYYDCAPFQKKVHNPISGKLSSYSRTAEFRFRGEFIEQLKRLRKVAIRLGELHDGRGWGIHKRVIKALLNGKQRLEELSPDDMYYDVKQKGVDIKIGLDIAPLAYKRFVERIVLISGDSDFVSAARLARREGIDFILDPMWNHVKPSLFEHIDGLRSVTPKPPRLTSSSRE